MIGPRAVLRLTSLVVFAAAMSAPGPSGSHRQFEDLRGKAMAADRAGRWQDAKQLWEQAHTIAPDAFQPIEGLVAVAAHLGKADEAFDWLENGYGGGFVDPTALRDDENYTSLHGDPRWERLLATLKSRWDDNLSRWRQREPDLDPQSAPAFKSHRKLAATFDRERKEFERDRWQFSLAEWDTRTSRMGAQRIAALHRYLAEHPTAGDRADAAWDLVETRIWPGYVYLLGNRWGDRDTQIVEDIDHFLRDYASSPHCGQASIDRAFAAFGARPEGGTEGQPWRDEDMLTLDRSLEETSRKYTATTAGGLALAWRLILAGDPPPHAGVADMRAMKAQLDDQYGHDREVLALLWQYRDATRLRISGIDEFNGTDLTGMQWTAASFTGQVTLIDFWATWCGPCVGELPTIRKAWKTYHDKGLAIIGVSLDFDDRATFQSWLARNDVAWPQIWDGKGFSTPLAKRYEVHGIPFTVLLDRNGRVNSVNLRGDALVARIKMLIDSANDPPSEKTSSLH